jgi:hypothetical protein
LWASAENAHLSINGDDLPIITSNRFLEVRVPLFPGDVIDLHFDIGLRRVPSINKNTIPGHSTLRHGPLILGVRNHGDALVIPENAQFTDLGDGRYAVDNPACLLEPINDIIHLSESAVLEDQRQILFKE